MVTESRTANVIRGLVKFVFIACYAAFMWASIHHVATYFDNFEQNGVSNLFGSYLLAGAFDVTALVTTIGVMFFRKSMPRYVQWIVWCFIIAIAGYSFFINWEYAAHFQNEDLVLQATGVMMPLFDMQGHLHYVPQMRANTALLVVNPLLASGFTLFSLIYSIVAEFFGTKAPTVEELRAKQTYLEETATVLEGIKKLEGKGKGKSLIQLAKEKAMEGKAAWKEVTKSEETEGQAEQDTDELEVVSVEESTEEPARKASGKKHASEVKRERQFELSDEANLIAMHYESTLSWLTASPSTVSLKVVSETMNLSMKLLRNRVESKRIRATKNKEIVYKESVIEWAMSEVIPKESAKIVHLKALRNEEDTSGESFEQSQDDKLAMTLDALANNPDLTDEMLAETLGFTRPASARFWRLKAQEMLVDRESVQV